jgi:Uma2 family endonuclease
MSVAPPASLVLQDFLRLPYIEESPAWEYINGVVLQKPMGGGKHSALQKRLVTEIDQAGNCYEAFPELRCTFGNRSVVPDIAVLTREQLPLDENGEITSGGVELAPIWVIEILSPDQSQTRVTGNILHCMRHGSQMGWLIDPKERSVLIFQPDRLPALLSGSEPLPVLGEIGLNLSPKQLFNWLHRSF